MAKVIILCGKIASGKSFYANKMKEQNNAIILSVDELMLNLSDHCLGNSHDDIANRCEKYFYQLAEQMVQIGLDVIIDFGYWSRKERLDAKSYFNNKNIKNEVHYVKCLEEKRYKQLQNRNELLISKRYDGLNDRVYIIDDDLRERLDKKFEEPQCDEVDKIISFD